MKKTVMIVKNAKSNLVFTPGAKEAKNGKFYGFYVVRQDVINHGEFITEDSRTAIMSVENSLGAKLSYAEGHEISGQIIRLETLVQTPGYQAVINPETKEPVLRQGMQLYRKDVFTPDLNACDALVSRELIEKAVPANVGGGLAD